MSSPSNGDGLRGSQHGQPSARPRIGIAGNAHTRRFYLDPEDLHRLQQVGDVAMIDYDVPMDGLSTVPEMPEMKTTSSPPSPDSTPCSSATAHLGSPSACSPGHPS